MSIPSEIAALVERFNQELNEIERSASLGLDLARVILERFPNNFTVIQLFAFLNTAMFFVDTSRRRIQTIVEHLSSTDANTESEIQEAGEDLATDLGQSLEIKIRISQVKTRLENLQ